MAKTIEQLTPAATLDGTELVELQQGDLSVKCTTQDIADLGGGGAAAYLVYTALLSQSGTDDPVATVLQNTLSDAVVWTRPGAGDLLGTLAGAFPSGRTVVFVSLDGGVSNGYFALGQRDSDNTVKITVYDAGFSGADDNVVTVEVRVYPS